MFVFVYYIYYPDITHILFYSINILNLSTSLKLSPVLEKINLDYNSIL